MTTKVRITATYDIDVELEDYEDEGVTSPEELIEYLNDNDGAEAFQHTEGCEPDTVVASLIQ